MENDLPLLQPKVQSPHLNDGASSVHHDSLPGDVVRSVGGEKHGDAFQLSRGADTGNRVARFNRGLGQLDGSVGEARMEEAGRDGVDADPLSSPRGGELARQTEQSCFARSVPDVMRSVNGRLQT